MENASKALLIAAAVLVAILIIAFGIKIFSSNSNTTKVAQDTGKSINDKTVQATEYAISSISGNNSINYGGKTKDTISVGDDITISGEKFRVYLKTSTDIYAVPYYNIELKLNKPKQSSTAKNIAFSSGLRYYERYKDIDMTVENNNVQQYINAYKNTLSVDEIIVKMPTYSPSKTIPNPSGIGRFWLGTYSKNNSQAVFFTPAMDSQIGTDVTNENICGVRPIIVIKIE